MTSRTVGVARSRRLSAADEIALATRIERGDVEAKQTLIESNVGLVVAVARTYRGAGVPFADLVQEGTVGLARAAERFDHRREVKFSTYAVWWIRRGMLDAIAAAKLIRLPAKASGQLAAIRHAEADCARTGSPASDAAIARRTGLGVVTVRALRTAASVSASLDAPVAPDSTPLGERVADDRAVDPLQRAIAREDARELAEMLQLLPARHRAVLTRRYGLNRTRPRSHEEIAASLGVGQERSRQIEREALRRLRSIAATRARSEAQRPRP